MTERVVLVTGAARGIGAATVRRLVERGDKVVAVDSCAGEGSELPYPLATREELDALVTSYGDAVITHVADVRDRKALQGAVDVALDRWQRIDAAVAAAAIITGGRPLWETEDEDLQLLWDLAARHGDKVAPAVLSLSTALGAAAILQRRWWSVPIAAVAVATLTRKLAPRLPV